MGGFSKKKKVYMYIYLFRKSSFHRIFHLKYVVLETWRWETSKLKHMFWSSPIHLFHIFRHRLICPARPERFNAENQQIQILNKINK